MSNSVFGVSGSMSVGRMAYSHNVRDTHTKNVDTALSSQNVTLVDKLSKYNGRVEDYVNAKMAPVIERYNEGKKPSRQIKQPYTDYRAHNKNLAGSPLCYEAVIQIGEHEGLGEAFYQRFQKNLQNGDFDKAENNKALWTKAYRDVLNDIRIKYPHLDVVGAWVHFDEPNGTPHMHIEYVPFGRPDRGLPVQVSIGRALQNDGIERIKNRAEAKELGGYQISKFYKQVQEEIIQPALTKFMAHFPNLNWERKEVQHGKPHLDVDTFKAVKDAEMELNTLKDKKKSVKAEIEALNAEIRGFDEYETYYGLAYAKIAQTYLRENGLEAVDDMWIDQAEAMAQEHFGINEIEESYDDMEH